MIYGVGEINIGGNVICCEDISVEYRTGADEVYLRTVSDVLARHSTNMTESDVYITIYTNFNSTLETLRLNLARVAVNSTYAFSGVFYTDQPFTLQADIIYLGSSSLSVGTYTLEFLATSVY
jgi:hypothetical protein